VNEPPRFAPSRPQRTDAHVIPPPSRALSESELAASFGRLRQRFREVAAVVEGLSALRSLGGEEALIEMAMFAQSHEHTLEQVWRAMTECEELARVSSRAVAPASLSEPMSGIATEPAPASLAPASLVPASLAPASLPLPLADSSEEEEGPVTQVDVGQATMVLVVDDDPTVLRAFRRVLQRDHQIVTARDGAEALRVVLGGARVDAIICDISMPKLDGPAFFSELFELRPQMMPRVVFCTGGLPNEKTQRFLDRLQAPLLFKPVAAADLLKAIDFVRSR
jgi:CheY-like chemotaxis protein